MRLLAASNLVGDDVSVTTMQRWADASTESGTSREELLPDRLSRACVRMLRVAGAGVSLIGDDVRVPLGASDDTASIAERLQFTTGHGPCWAAHSSGHPVRASAADMAQRWPRYASRLLADTPYRSIVSVPLPSLGNGWSGALDLYLDQPTRAYVFGVSAASVVGELLSAELRSAIDGHAGAAQDDDAPSPAPAPQSTWLALGLVAVERDTSAAGALALLRGHAPCDPWQLTARRILEGSLACEDLDAGSANALAVAV